MIVFGELQGNVNRKVLVGKLVVLIFIVSSRLSRAVVAFTLDRTEPFDSGKVSRCLLFSQIIVLLARLFLSFS